MSREILNLSMLYVEDDVDTRTIFTELFEYRVNTLYVAKDGIEALELFKNNIIHFVISDYQMPRMNGNELCSKIKELDPLVTFVLLTAYNDKELLASAIDAGVDRFLKKPIEDKKLTKVLDEIEKKVYDRFQLEQTLVCLKEAEHIAQLSYWNAPLDSKEIYFSQEVKQLFGLTCKGEVTLEMLTSKVQEEDKERFITIFAEKIFDSKVVDAVINISTTQSTRYIHILSQHWKSTICGNHHVIGMFQDVSSYEEEKKRLLYQNQFDSLLKIFNKQYIYSELETLIKSSKRYGSPIGVIFLDIDNFKKINDTLGHVVADDLLIELTDLISSNIRQSDLFGRWGGDEFILVTSYDSPDATIHLAEKLSLKIREQSWRCKVNLTVSMGLAFYEIGDDVNRLIDRADCKMLQAKRNGKNRYDY